MKLKFFGFGVLTESAGTDICAATDGATATPAIVGFETLKSFRAAIEGRSVPAHMPATPIEARLSRDHRFGTFEKFSKNSY
jgi:hypothetical protein